LEVFVEPILPPALLYIFGAGHVAASVCRTAAHAGFDVIVLDDRSSYATQERFPAAQQVHALDFDEAMKKFDPNESSYIVIVTRGHRDDMRILRWAVETRARYVGMIGSRRKVIEIFKALQAEGLPPHLFDHVHAPIGLDIGAVTPEEIGVAITAELIALRRHSAAALPYMSWFKEHQSESDSTPENTGSLRPPNADSSH
jgi:xanthine dehydrogenase accessory factor